MTTVALKIAMSLFVETSVWYAAAHVMSHSLGQMHRGDYFEANEIELIRQPRRPQCSYGEGCDPHPGRTFEGLYFKWERHQRPAPAPAAHLPGTASGER